MSNLPKRQPKSKRPHSSNKQQASTRDALQQVDRLNQQLQLGIKYCQSGQLQQAEVCFQQVLQWQPDNPDAYHLLGVIAAQQGHFQTAIEQIQRAIALNSKEATFHHNLGNVYQQSGQLQQAIESYSKALQLKPDDTEIRKHLDIACEKQLDLGIEYHQSGELPKAEACYQQVLQRQPNRADIWHLWGIIAYQQEQYFTAIKRINRAIELEPSAANFYQSLAFVYQKQQCFTDAITYYQKAIQIQAELVQSYNNLGLIYQEQGMVQQAIAHYQQAIQLQPNYTYAHLNLGIAYDQVGQFELAISSCQKVIELDPGEAEAYVQLGIIFRKQGKLTDAIASYQRALQLNPSSAAIYSNLGGALKDQGTLKEAINSYQHALQLDPSWTVARSNLVFCLHYGSDYKPSEIYAEHRQWGERLAAPLTAAIQPHTNDANPARRLRIGYVSSDFKTHSVAYFFEPLLAAHNHQDFEIICYANNKQVDVTTQRLRQLADGWREIAFLKDEQVAELIRQDRIDILIDLSGHTADNRLLVFARKPAPIQVTYLGYPNTTGLDTMDYRIVDAWTDPEGQTEHLHTEQLIRLPHGFLCYQPPQDSPAISPPPVLERGQITFGSFNNLPKVSPQLVSYWAQLLKAVPNSRLLLKAKPLVDPSTRNYLQEQFQQQGIGPNQLELVGWLPYRSQHLTLYHQVDIALDTFPYHGTTTTCEAMWMGVPVITLAGQTHVSRVGVSLLSSVGLEELIAQSPEAYIQKAIALASDLERLQELRATLRDRMKKAPLTNATLIVQSVEEAYRIMWQRFCGQKLTKPDKFLVMVKGGVTLAENWLCDTQKEYRPKPNLNLYDTETIKNHKPETLEQNELTQLQKRLNLGIEHHQAGRLQEAEACYQQVLQWQPNNFEICNNLGNALKEQGRLQEAVVSFQQVLKLKPDYADAHYNLGNVLQDQGKLQEAIACYQRALQLNPNFEKAHNNLGNALQNQGKLEEALACYQRTIQLNPSFEKAHNNLGNALQDQGKLEEALACYQRALQLNPNYKVAQDNLVFALYYSSEYQPSEIYAKHQKWGERIALLITEPIQHHNNERNPKRRLRIGYVSGDFKTHSVSYFFEPLLAAHNQCDFEIICYANNRKADTKTQQLRQLAHGWHEIYALTDEQVAQLIHQDKIDILVDLSGHTADNRLLVFAHKPAPIQFSYIGYPGTTGLNVIDYRLTDAWADPPGKTEHLYTEELVRLPHGFLCYQPPQDCPSVSPLPVLEKGQITFGSFNNLAKVSPPLVAYWSEILTAVPNSRLLLKFKSLIDPGTRDYLRGLFQEQGIGSERLELMGWAPTQSEHLSVYNQVDIALDTFPYHGTTTTCEALWMGVPVITLAGQTHVSRVGVSLLHSVGLEQLIAQSPQEYIQKAVELANNWGQLKQLRMSQRDRIKASPLTNAKLIVQSLENVYRTVWQDWCNRN